MNNRPYRALGAALAACALFAGGAHADVYKWTDAEGHVHFGDAVPRDAEKRAKAVPLHDPHPQGSAPAPAPAAASNASSFRPPPAGAPSGGEGGAAAPSSAAARAAGRAWDAPAAEPAPKDDRHANNLATGRTVNREIDDDRNAANKAADRAIYDGHRSDPERTVARPNDVRGTAPVGTPEENKRFRDSQECYARFHLAGAGIRPGAYEACGEPVADPNSVQRR